MIKALIGLGNPGEQYEKTYHNVGVFVAQELARLAAADEHAPRQLLVYKPESFMNISGPAVLAWMKMKNLTLPDVLVAHDDADLPVGSYKLVKAGGSAGHKGIESLIATWKTEEFMRLKIGVRDPQEQERKKAGDFVLTRYSGADEELFKKAAQSAWAQLKESR